MFFFIMMIYTCAGLLMLIKKIVDHFLYRRQQPQGLAHTEKKGAVPNQRGFRGLKKGFILSTEL